MASFFFGRTAAFGSPLRRVIEREGKPSAGFPSHILSAWGSESLLLRRARGSLQKERAVERLPFFCARTAAFGNSLRRVIEREACPFAVPEKTARIRLLVFSTAAPKAALLFRPPDAQSRFSPRRVSLHTSFPLDGARR